MGKAVCGDGAENIVSLGRAVWKEVLMCFRDWKVLYVDLGGAAQVCTNGKIKLHTPEDLALLKR